MPVPYRAQVEGEEVLFCLCKQTRTPPFCDGSHNNLPGAYENDDPNSAANRAIETVERARDAKTALDGQCYIFAPDCGAASDLGGAQIVRIISHEQGAQHQSLFRATIAPGASSVFSLGDRNGMLFISDGEGRINIGGRVFDFSNLDSVLIRPGDDFRIEATASVTLFISACPAIAAPIIKPQIETTFDDEYPARIAKVDAAKRNEMADRFFQVLIDKSMGSETATQFIGHIPLSKAQPHRHLYEEALLILSGEGVMWTETRKAAVKSGDVIFLPQRELHSLQCTDQAGMDVVGVIYPGDNPAVNY